MFSMCRMFEAASICFTPHAVVNIAPTSPLPRKTFSSVMRFSFAKENRMTLENVLRGSGDVGAMLTTAWGVKQIDAASNILHIENIKPRDFQPCGPFQI